MNSLISKAAVDDQMQVVHLMAGVIRETLQGQTVYGIPVEALGEDGMLVLAYYLNNSPCACEEISLNEIEARLEGN